MLTFRGLLASFLDLLYPPTCLACGSLLHDARAYVCPVCWSGVMLSRDHPELAAEAAARLRPDVDAVVAAFVFQKTGPLQTLVHALKYQSMDQVGVWLGERMGEMVSAEAGRVDLLVPVPLHRAKERERGYNQAEMIARGLADRLKSRVEPAMLRRRRHTPTQTKLTVEQRRVNVSEAFEIDASARNRLAGATVMVVDDVITTGATIGACAKALREAGAARVLAGAVALADHQA